MIWLLGAAKSADISHTFLEAPKSIHGRACRVLVGASRIKVTLEQITGRIGSLSGSRAQ